MKAIIFTARNQVEYGTLPDPVAGQGEVIVEVKASGICHTDFEVIKANYGASNFPLVPGHEYVGTIAELGPGVSGWKVGDRVAVDPNLECGSCRSCRKGWAHLCETLGAYGVSCNGGFAEYSKVSANALTSIANLDYNVAALAEPMGCALNGVDTVYESYMDNALIFGAGPMGLLLAFCLKSKGVENVVMVDIDESRLERAKSFGFEATGTSSEDSRNFLKSLEQGVDIVADATGVPAVAEKLTTYMADGGTGLFFGVCPSDVLINVSPFEIFRRQLKLIGTHSLNHNIPDALKIITENQIQLAHLVSHKLSLEEISEVLCNKPPQGSLKIQSVV